MILAHGGHTALFLLPLGAVAYLAIMLRGDKKRRQRSSSSTLIFPTSPLSRQVHSATRPPKPQQSKATTQWAHLMDDGQGAPNREVTSLRPPSQSA